jgi:hypothetical protein
MGMAAAWRCMRGKTLHGFASADNISFFGVNGTAISRFAH